MDGNVTLGICVDDNTACDVQSLGQKGYCRCSRGFVKTEEGRVTNCEEPPKRIFNEAMRKIYIEPERQIDISFNIEKKYKPKNFQLTMFPSHGDIKTTFQNSTIELDVRNAVLHRSQRIMIRMTTQIDKIFIADSMLLELNVITQKNTTTKNESIMENATDGTIVYRLEGDYTNYELEGCSSNFVVQNDKQIVTKGELDRETIDEYVCIVKAYPNDNISCVLEEIAKLFINVTDVNDNPPTFDITLYSGRISENEPINTTVEMQIPISSTDRDIPSNNETYKIVDGDTEFFYLEKLNKTREVNIKSKKILDRETHKFHHLSINAFDGVNWSPVVNVTIVVVDVDEPPKFKHDHYSFNVSEKNDGGLVGTVLAEDNDEEGHDLILYTIKSGAFGKFRVDSKNGSIFLQGDVPSKNNTSYDFIIFATYENVTTNVSVFVLDVNESPVFEKSFVFYVNEQNNGSIYIGTIKAFDPDFGNNASLIYQVIESNPKRSFFFPNQPNNGTLFIQDGLDYEKIKMLNFVVKAVDGGNKSATTTVVVHVRDVNDNKPIPTKEEFSTVISSRSLNFFEKPLLIIEASDADSGDNGRLFYSIVDNEDGVFGITHDGVVIVNKTVNSLQKQTYRFRVNISDRGNPPQSTLVNVSIRVDSTTKEPWFKDPKIILSLKEQSYNNTILIENMTSYLEKWNGKSVSFKLDDFIEGITLSENGVLKLNKTIDRETQENYKLIVSVKDNNNITSDITLIQLNVNDTNDNYPKVNAENIEFVTILENEEYGTNVILVNATDADEDTVFEYSIVNETVPFVIDEEGYVTVSGELDRENISEYNLGIKVSDGENYILVPVTVYVLDVNDNPPNISSTSFDISESHQTKTIVTNIYFLDADTRVSELTLTVDKDCPINIIPDNSNKNTLASKNTSAEVLLAQPLDYERKKKYLCEIVVSDGTENNITIQSSTYTLTITVMDENDNAPEIINFKEKEVNLTVFDPVGKIIVQSISATDEDSGKNGEILFRLLKANKDPFDKFVINETTGQIAIASELLNVDFGTYKMVIEASDQGVQPKSSTAVCMIKIPQSKDIPIILSEKTEYEVDENKVDVTLDTLQIHDFINNERIPCELCKFHLDDDYVDISENGVLSLKRGLDREKFSVYKFLVRAEDNDVPTNTGAKQFTIHIKDVNEYEPKCGMNSFDNTKEENILGYINVTDDDATSVFKYEKHNSSRVCDNSLLVNYTSGLININQTPKKFENCTMETKISDERYTLDCTISITIYPGNVYAPQFTKGLYETTLPVDAKKGYRLVIYNFKANDSDGDQVMYYFPRKQEIDGYFQINPKTGILMLYSDLKVDETTTVITKALIAVDGANKPKTATTIVKISLTGRVCLNEDAYNTQTKTSTLYTILFYVILSCLCVFIVLFVLSCYKWQSFKRRETVLKSKYYYSYPLPTRYREPVKISDGIFDRAYNTGQKRQG